MHKSGCGYLLNQTFSILGPICDAFFPYIHTKYVIYFTGPMHARVLNSTILFPILTFRGPIKITVMSWNGSRLAVLGGKYPYPQFLVFNP